MEDVSVETAPKFITDGGRGKFSGKNLHYAVLIFFNKLLLDF